MYDLLMKDVKILTENLIDDSSDVIILMAFITELVSYKIDFVLNSNRKLSKINLNLLALAYRLNQFDLEYKSIIELKYILAL